MGKFYFKVNDARYPHRGTFALKAGDSLVFPEPPTIYEALVPYSHRPLEIDFRMMEHDVLSMDDYMVGKKEWLAFKDTVHLHRWVSEDGKTSATVRIRLEKRDPTLNDVDPEAVLSDDSEEEAAAEDANPEFEVCEISDEIEEKKAEVAPDQVKSYFKSNFFVTCYLKRIEVKDKGRYYMKTNGQRHPARGDYRFTKGGSFELPAPMPILFSGIYSDNLHRPCPIEVEVFRHRTGPIPDGKKVDAKDWVWWGAESNVLELRSEDGDVKVEVDVHISRGEGAIVSETTEEAVKRLRTLSVGSQASFLAALDEHGAGGLSKIEGVVQTEGAPPTAASGVVADGEAVEEAKADEAVSSAATPVSAATAEEEEAKPPADAEEARQAETEETKATETEEAKPAEAEAAKAAEADEAKPAEAEDTKPAETEETKAVEAEEAKPTETEEVKPAEEAANPVEEAAKPAEDSTPAQADEAKPSEEAAAQAPNEAEKAAEAPKGEEKAAEASEEEEKAAEAPKEEEKAAEVDSTAAPAAAAAEAAKKPIKPTERRRIKRDPDAPAVCVECNEGKPKARVRRHGVVLWLCKACLAKTEQHYAEHGTLRGGLKAYEAKK